MLNKLLKFISISLISTTIVSCGGGGGGGASTNNSSNTNNNIPFSLNSTSNGVGEIYQGKQQQAPISKELALNLLEKIFFDINNVLNRTINIEIDSTLQNINENNSGNISGNFSLNGKINEKDGLLTAKWDNYSNRSGYITNGKVTYDFVTIDPINGIVKLIVFLDELLIVTPSSNFKSTGNIFSQENFNYLENISVFDIDIFDENNGIYYSYDNLKIDDQESIFSTIEGRVYKSDEGYVNLSTIENLSEVVAYGRPRGGVLAFIGNNSSVNFKFANQFPEGRIDITESNQDTVEPINSIYNWRYMEAWKSENNPPEIDVKIDELYETVDRIEANVYSSDIDGDEVVLEYTWFVNGEQIINDYVDAENPDIVSEPQILPSYYFKAGDLVELKVNANDGFINQDISKTITASEIKNVRPEIVIKNSIRTGDFYLVSSFSDNTGVLDASQSIDRDGDTLEFNWLQDSFYDDDLIIHQPNLPKTSITCGINLGCKTQCFILQTKEYRNAELVGSFNSFGKSVCFTD